MTSGSSETATGGLAAPRILAAAADGIVASIERDRGDPATVFARAGVASEDLASPVNELDLARFCALFEEAARLTTNDNFGLRFGYDFAPRRLGPIGYLAINSPTLGAGLANLVRYFPAHQESSILRFETGAHVSRLIYRITDPEVRARRQDAELSIGMFMNIFWHALGRQWAPLEITFEHPAPEGRDEHASRFQAPVRFGEPDNAILFRTSDLDSLMPGHDPYLFNVVEPFMAGRRQLRQPPERFSQLVREALMIELGERAPRLESVAATLGMTPWTLRRRLEREGLVFNDLLRAVRQDLAERHVRGSDLPLTEIAFALGYSELSAFSRAFRAWTGMAPQRYRRLARR